MKAQDNVNVQLMRKNLEQAIDAMEKVKDIAQNMVSDMYKEVYGSRPRHWTADDWNNPKFLEAQVESMEAYVSGMSPEDRVAQGWSVIEADD